MQASSNICTFKGIARFKKSTVTIKYGKASDNVIDQFNDTKCIIESKVTEPEYCEVTELWSTIHVDADATNLWTSF